MPKYLVLPIFALIIAFISSGKNYKNYSVNIPFLLRAIYLVIAITILHNGYHKNLAEYTGFFTARGVATTVLLFIGCSCFLGVIEDLIIAGKNTKAIKKIQRKQAMKKINESRVYTVLNADDLVIGSQVILGDTLSELKTAINASQESAVQILTAIHNESTSRRFVGNRDASGYSLAYLIESSSLPEYTEIHGRIINVVKNIWAENIFMLTMSVCFILLALALKG